MAKAKKEEKCEHSFLPIIWIDDYSVYGTIEEDVKMESGFVIVRCSDCGLEGYCISNS